MVSKPAKTSETDSNAYALSQAMLDDTQQVFRYTLQHMAEVYEHADEGDIEAILSSPEWRLITRLVKLRKRVAPAGSKRERLFKWFKRQAYRLNTPDPTTQVQRQPKTALSEFIRPLARNPYYQKHIKMTEPTTAQLRQQRDWVAAWSQQPLFSIVTPVYNTDLWMLTELVHSIRTQSYPHWQWVLVDASDADGPWQHLEQITADLSGVVRLRVDNQGISANTNIGLRAAEGDFIVAIDHDDLIAPDALFELARCVNQHPDVDLMYSDMDKLDPEGLRVRPFFKPGWSPETMLCANIATHLTCYRRSLLERVGYLDSHTDVAQDWDLYLRISEVTDQIQHLPRVLYHWRMSASSTAGNDQNKRLRQPQALALRQHLQRLGLPNPDVRFDETDAVRATHPIVSWSIVAEQMVSIIIVLSTEIEREQIETLIKCIETRTSYPHYELIIVDTLTTAALDLNAAQLRYSHQPNLTSIYQAYNVATQQAAGSYLIFLDAQTIELGPDWVTKLLQWFDKDDKIAAVSAKSLHPDGTIHHAGVLLSTQPIYPFADSPERGLNLIGTNSWYRNWLGINPACFACRKAVLEAVDHFDEAFQQRYGELALCLRFYERGYRCVQTPDVVLQVRAASMTEASNAPDWDRYRRSLHALVPDGDPHANPNVWFHQGQPVYSFGLNANTIHALLHATTTSNMRATFAQ